MAKGRFLSKEIAVDKRVNGLKDPWSIIGFTWLIAHADCDGRTYGDPGVVKGLLFSRQNGNVSVEDVEKFIKQWHKAGLIIWYEVGGDKYIEFPNFDKHQIGLRKEREPKSTIPPNPAANIRQTSDKHPAEFNLIEVNAIEVNENVMEANAQTETPSNLLSPSKDQIKAWNMALGDLQSKISKADFDTWLKPVELVSVQGSVFTIRAVNKYGADMVKSRYAPTLNGCLQGYYGSPTKLEVTV